MPRAPLTLLSLVLAATIALGLAACGGEDAKLLPGETAREITANLDTVKQLAAEGDCLGAESATEQVGEQVESLQGVDHRLKLALEEGVARLQEVIASCEESSSEAIAPAELPVEPEEGEEEEEKAAKAREKEGEGDKHEPPAQPSLPPQPKGEAKGLENGNGPPPKEEAPAPEEGAEDEQSGGVGPGAAVGGGD